MWLPALKPLDLAACPDEASSCVSSIRRNHSCAELLLLVYLYLEVETTSTLDHALTPTLTMVLMVMVISELKSEGVVRVASIGGLTYTSSKLRRYE